MYKWTTYIGGISIGGISMCGQEFEVTKRSNTEIARVQSMSLEPRVCKDLTASRARLGEFDEVQCVAKSLK